MNTESKEHTPVLHSAPEDASYVEPILTTPIPAHIPVLRQLGVAMLLLVVVFGATYVGTIVALVSPENGQADVAISAKLGENASDTFTQNPFDSTRINGRSAFVWDIRTQRVLFNKNADEPLPLASVTKLMTALVAYELLEDESKINITIESIKTDGDSGLSDGQVFSLKELTDLVLIASSNDGAMALSAAAGNAVNGSVDPNKLFVHAMNLRAEELGLTNTHFENPTGLDISPTEPGAVSSARDVALLLEYIITTYPSVTSLTTADATRIYNEAGEYYDIENTNEIVDDIDGLIASKTGFTELAGGNLAIAFDAGLNRPIVVVVLGSTYEERFSDVKALSDRARTYIATLPE